MRWQLHDGTREIEPTPEEQVVAALRAGQIATTVLVRREGTTEWLPLRSHAPFAMALEATTAARAHAPPSAARRPIGLYVIGGIAALAAAILVPLAIVRLSRGADAVVASPAATAEAMPVPAPPAPPPAAPKTHPALAAPSFGAAVKLARPSMADTREDISPGGAVLALWGAKNGTWGDVAIQKDETSFAKVQKDSDEERGKRYCASGSIIQIATVKTDAGKLGVGLLMDDSAHLWHFSAFGSSGAIVERHAARLCGVVTGRYDYANSGGGVGHAVEIVGMFDIPENRKPKGGAPIKPGDL